MTTIKHSILIINNLKPKKNLSICNLSYSRLLYLVKHNKIIKMESTKSTFILKQTFNLLKYTFVVVPIVAGVDKFTNFLTNWTQYLHPSIVDLLPFSAGTFMMIIGVIEVIAGIIVLKKTEIGGYIVAGWLTLIALTLITSFSYVDVAVRDLVMAVAALSMARLSKMVK